MKIKKIVVTGGLGFLGQHLVKKLSEKYKNSEILITARSKRKIFLPEIKNNPKVSIIYNTDLTDIDTFGDSFKDTDIVFHCAALVSFQRRDKKRLFKMNIDGTRNIIRLCKENNVQKLIYVSSTAARGYNNNKDIPADEKFIFDWSKTKTRYYMLSKHLAEEAVINAADENFQTIIANPSTINGPGDERMFSLVNSIENNNLPAMMPGGYAIVDVRDLADGIVLLAESGNSGENYLFAGGNYSYEEVFTTLADILGVNPPSKTLPMGSGPLLTFLITLIELISIKPPKLTAELFAPGFKYRYYSSAKVKNELGWTPEYSLRQTLLDVVSCYTKRIVDDEK